jgi:predicted dehydrogenase
MHADPYDEQFRHLRALVEGREAPLCSGRDAMATLRTALAVHESAQQGATVNVTA